MGGGGKIDSQPITLERPRTIPGFSNLYPWVSKGYVHIQGLPGQGLPVKHTWTTDTASSTSATSTAAPRADQPTARFPTTARSEAFASLGRLSEDLWQAADLVTGVVSRCRHSPARLSYRPMVEAEALPSGPVLLSASTVLWPPPTAARPSSHFGAPPYRNDLAAKQLSQVAPLAVLAFRSPYAGGFAPTAPASQWGLSPSPNHTRLGLLLRLSAVLSRRGRIPVMVRTASSPPPCRRVVTPLSRPPRSARPGLATRPAGGYHGRTSTGWSTKPSPGTL